MEYYGVSDIGKVRSENQDMFLHSDLGLLHLFAVCDGMGGMSGGSVASKIAIESFGTEFKRLCDEFLSLNSPDSFSLVLSMFLKKSVDFACKAICEREAGDAALSGMGTTLVAFSVYEGILYAVNVGDSRLYRYSEGEISLITKDHSLNRLLLDNGDPDGASGKGKNILMRSLGSNRDATPDQYVIPVDEKDILILCSDGFYNPIEKDISDILSKNAENSAKDIANQLLQISISRDPSDNLTAIVVKI